MSSMSQSIDQRLRKRELLRAEKDSVADEIKETGNSLYRAGDFYGAALTYKLAIDSRGQKPILLSNLAAALIKMGEYEAAESAADDALWQGPTFLKARFRRGIARKGLGQLAAAISDFETILVADPGNVDAKAELASLRERVNAGEEDASEGDPEDYTIPHHDSDPWDIESISDSSDCGHDGNGIACRFYNRDGCLRGHGCQYSHAPDSKSIRDGLGRNVCIYYILGSCKFGSIKCHYAHSKEYLPKHGWWSEDELIDAFRSFFQPDPWDYREPTDREIEEALRSLKLSDYRRNNKRNRQQKKKGKAKTHSRSQDNPTGGQSTLHGASKENVATGSGQQAQVSMRNDDKAKENESGSSSINFQRSASNLTVRDKPALLVLSLNPDPYLDHIYDPLMKALRDNFRVVKTSKKAEALEHLSSSTFQAVFVSDAGIAKRPHAAVRVKLMELVKNGGCAVLGGHFCSFLGSSDMNAFFRNCGLQWKMGSYHRTTFQLNPLRPVPLRGDNSLPPSYSMKAVHLASIPGDAAVYLPEEDARLESHVFLPVPITNMSEAPVVFAPVGRGYFGYMGDVNAEDESTAVIVGMLKVSTA